MNSLVKSGMDKKKENRDRTFGITLIAIILIILLSWKENLYVLSFLLL
jgi:t-SNARE complex subunit (syntaxin)